MRPLLVVAIDPEIEIVLQVRDRGIELLAEGDAVELIEDGLVEALSDAIRLRALRLGPRMVDVLDGEIKLVFVMLGIAAIFRAAIGQHPRKHHFFFVEERHDPVIQEIGRRDRRLAIIEFGKGHFRIGVDEGLLIDAANALHVADVESVLRAAIAGALAFELTSGDVSIKLRLRSLTSPSPCASFSVLAFSKATTCASVKIRPSCATLASRALRRFFIVSRSCRCQTPRTPAGEIENPSLLISLATRIWPKAGCSREKATIRASISGAVRFARIGFLREISCSASSPPLS